MFKLLKLLVKLTVLGIVIFFSTILILSQVVHNRDVDSYLNAQSQEIEFLTEKINELTDQNMTLIGQLQEVQRDNGKLSLTVKNFEKPDVLKMLNGSVRVLSLLGEGSGTVIKKTDKAMYILTCNHVVEDLIATKIKPRVSYNINDDKIGMIVYFAKIVKAEKDCDLALLKVDIVDSRLAEIAIAEEEPQKGDTIYVVGNPLSATRNISKGILSNKIDGFYVTDALTTFGNSGGALYNQKAELIGVPAQVEGYSDATLFVPESSMGQCRDLSTVKKFLEGVEY